MTDDRRRLERIRLEKPFQARLGSIDAKVLEIGLLGALLEHEQPLEPGTEGNLDFEREGVPVSIRTAVRRSDFQSLLSEARGSRTYFSGVEFLEAAEESAGALRRIIEERISEEIESWKANARGVASDGMDQAFQRIAPRQKTQTRASGSFVCCRLSSDGSWRKSILNRPAQPVDGFTVPLGDTEEEVDRLCEAYQRGSAEVRKLIRLCAEMSTIESSSSIPPPSYSRR